MKEQVFCFGVFIGFVIGAGVSALVLMMWPQLLY